MKKPCFPFSIFACRLKIYQVTETKLKKCHSFFSLFSVYNVIQFLISFVLVVITRKLNLKVKFLFWQFKLNVEQSGFAALKFLKTSSIMRRNITFFFFLKGTLSGDYFALESVMLGRYDTKLQNLN